MKIRHKLGIVALIILIAAIYYFPVRLRIAPEDYAAGVLYMNKDGQIYENSELTAAQTAEFVSLLETPLWTLRNALPNVPVHGTPAPNMVQAVLYSEDYRMLVYVFPDTGKISIDIISYWPARRLEYKTTSPETAAELCAVVLRCSERRD